MTQKSTVGDMCVVVLSLFSLLPLFIKNNLKLIWDFKKINITQVAMLDIPLFKPLYFFVVVAYCVDLCFFQKVGE